MPLAAVLATLAALAAPPVLAAEGAEAPQEPGRAPESDVKTEATNHLAGETSPYLLQHVHNPVDWYPWGEEALRKAKEEDKPIFLSIGYSACHWCHVMEHESFENEEIAAFLNEHFVPIKVDREERPDLDALYMSAVQRLTGRGGWPMSVWLTPELEPFYGGTYYPPEPRMGMPGFLQVLERLAELWEEDRARVEEAADSLSAALDPSFPELEDDASRALLDERAYQTALASWVADLRTAYDPEWGGFGQAPKFPRAEDLRFLLAAAHRLPEGESADHAREMALHTLRRMTEGGMWDRLAGGFARYSVDARWLIPHFEKMLYDQGTLIPAYLEAWRLSGDDFHARIARETCEYLLDERRDPAGGFHSSTDADSEGVEGKFFSWTPAQLDAVLGPERGSFAAELYGVTEEGNFEHGTSVLTAAKTPAEAARAAGLDAADAEALAEEVRAALYAARQERVPPGNDDKILTGWNGLAIGALAQAGRMLGEPRYVEAAADAAEFLRRELRGEDGWRRAWREGRAQHDAVLEDHAYLCQGLLELFMATGELRWLERAAEHGDILLADFWDEETGIFWDTDGDDPTLLHRMKSPWDGATPSPNAVALECLVRLHAFTGEARWHEHARRGYAAVTPMLRENPRAFTTTLRGYAGIVEEPAVAVVIGTGARASLEGWRRALLGDRYADALPVLRAAAAPDADAPLLAGRTPVDGKATLYLCRGMTCEAPVTAPGD